MKIKLRTNDFEWFGYKENDIVYLEQDLGAVHFNTAYYSKVKEKCGLEFRFIYSDKNNNQLLTFQIIYGILATVHSYNYWIIDYKTPPTETEPLETTDEKLTDLMNEFGKATEKFIKSIKGIMRKK